MLKRVAIAYDAGRGWHVDLPTYRMVSGTWQPVVAGLVSSDGVVAGAAVVDVVAVGPTVVVELPDDFPLHRGGGVDVAALRTQYRGHPRYGSYAFRAPAVHDPE